MKQLLLSILLTLIATGANAWEDWSTSDRQLFVASSVAITADWATTRWAARNNWPNNTYETNAFMGRSPTVSRVDNHFVVVLISNYIVADLLPKDYRGMYLTFRTVTHGYAAHRNVEMGWQIKF
jgi:hypothetical protein